MQTWENLQARLFHLGWLGEELPAFVATPGGAWLFRELVREAHAVAEIAAEYVEEYEKAGLTSTDTPPRTKPTDLSGPVDTGTATCGGEAL